MSKEKKEKKSFWIRALKKLPWVFAFCIVFLIVSLKVVEQFPKPLKEGFEDYFSTLSGYRVSITELENIRFFPEIHIQIKEMTFSDTANIALTKMSIEKVSVRIPFLNMFGFGRNIYGVSAINIEAKEDVLTPQLMHIQTLNIIDLPAEDEQAALLISGQYAQEDFTMQVRLKKDKTLLGKSVYKVPDQTTMMLDIGTIGLNTDFVKNGQDIWFKNATLERDGNLAELEDTALFMAGEIEAENIMACLLEADYKRPAIICERYVRK